MLLNALIWDLEVAIFYLTTRPVTLELVHVFFHKAYLGMLNPQ